jgi:ABC-2 type transport system permease protein
MKTLRLLAVFFRIGAMNELAYRANFWVQVSESLLTAVTSLGAILLVFRQTDRLGGWTADELLGLMGVYFLVLGLINVVIAPSLSRFMEDVRLGTLDYTLTKPVDAQLLVSISQVQIWKLFDVLIGAGLLGAALLRLAGTISWLQVAMFVAALLAGGVIVYSFWILLVTCAFWWVRVENILYIFWSVYVAGRWPIGIYPPWLRFVLTAIVPVAFAVTVPAEAVAGRLSGRTLLGGCLLALALLLLSRWFWRHGVRRYSGASA